jgi:hypothetical protein
MINRAASKAGRKNLVTFSEVEMSDSMFKFFDLIRPNILSFLRTREASDSCFRRNDSKKT